MSSPLTSEKAALGIPSISTRKLKAPYGSLRTSGIRLPHSISQRPVDLQVVLDDRLKFSALVVGISHACGQLRWLAARKIQRAGIQQKADLLSRRTRAGISMV